MLEEGLKILLSQLGLRQSELAKLLDVSPRAVNMWAVGDVALPGPVAGYLRLLGQLSPEKRASEFKRLPGRTKMFDEGIYRFQYRAQAFGELDSGQAFCVLRCGKIVGADPWGGGFSGSYTFNPTHETTQVRVAMSVPGNGMLVTGLSAEYDNGEFEIVGSFERADPMSKAVVKVAGVPVEIALTYLGPLPE